MTEAVASDLSAEQNVQLVDDKCCVRPEQTNMVESNHSDMEPVQNAEMTDFSTSDTNFCQKAEETKASNCDSSFDQHTQLTEANNSDQETQLAEDSNSDNNDLKGQLLYRCKKCRRIVAVEESLVSHKQGKGEGSFRGRRKSVEPNPPECTAIFVEPLKWMEPVQEGYLFEKLYCAGCKTKLGCFNWAGMQCSCGAWVTPAFQILKSRVDECQI